MKCYGSLGFMLAYGPGSFPLILSDVAYSKAFLCGSSEEITATVINPDEYVITGTVNYDFRCTVPDEWGITGQPVSVTIAQDEEKIVKFRIDIPEKVRGNNCQIRVYTDGINNPYYEQSYFLHKGAVNIHCGNIPPYCLIYSFIRMIKKWRGVASIIRYIPELSFRHATIAYSKA